MSLRSALLGGLAKLWASPNTLLGLLLGALALPFGARVRLGDNAVNFLGHPLLPIRRARAITFGNCVLYRRGSSPDDRAPRYDGGGWQRVGDHERAHTLQYQIWGPLFLPVYLALWVVRRPHPLECQADRWAARSTSNRDWHDREQPPKPADRLRNPKGFRPDIDVRPSRCASRDARPSLARAPSDRGS